MSIFTGREESMIEKHSLKRGLNMSEACIYIGNISRPTMYRLMGERELHSYLIGARRYFLKDELDAFLERQVEKAE